MSVCWLQDLHCHWFWPTFGTFCAIVSAIFIIRVFYFYVSALSLVIYLVF